VLFIRVSNERATFVFLSSEFGLYREGKDWAIRIEDENAAEFEQTGLAKSSYLISTEAHFDVPLASFDGVYCGRIDGKIRSKN
jgi:hypothetical protein